MREKMKIIKEGGQSRIVQKGRKTIKKIFKNTKTYERESFIHSEIIQPLNSMFKQGPFAIAYPERNPQNNPQETCKNELRMKKYEGDIQMYLQNNKNLSENEIRLIFVRMVYPVYILHFNKVYHGDLKPENFLYETTKDKSESDINIFLTDFGGAYWLNSRLGLIYSPFCYSREYHPINLLDKNHPYFNPFLADCYMLGVILKKITVHLIEPSYELTTLINNLLLQRLQIEDILYSSWIINNAQARELLNSIQKPTQKARFSYYEPSDFQIFNNQNSSVILNQLNPQSSYMQTSFPSCLDTFCYHHHFNHFSPSYTPQSYPPLLPPYQYNTYFSYSYQSTLSLAQ